jgi:hypothetical protein
MAWIRYADSLATGQQCDDAVTDTIEVGCPQRLTRSGGAQGVCRNLHCLPYRPFWRDTAVPYAHARVGQELRVYGDCCGGLEQLPHSSCSRTPTANLLGYVGGRAGNACHGGGPFGVGNPKSLVGLGNRIGHSRSRADHASWADPDRMGRVAVRGAGFVGTKQLSKSIAYQRKNPINCRSSTGAIGFDPQHIARPGAE